MSGHILIWFKKQPVFAFYILAFFFTWLGWIPQAAYSHGLFPFDSPVFYVFGGIGPLLAAFIVLKALKEGDPYSQLFSSLINWRIKISWYFMSFFLYVVIWVAVVILSGLSAEFYNVELSFTIITTFLTYFVAAIPEEVAWRGFVLPRLQSKYNALIASLIIGFLWALWHLPLLMIKDSIMAAYPIVPFFIECIAMSVVYTWLYNYTKGSVLIVTLFHAYSNTSGHIIRGGQVEQMIVAIILAAILIIIFKNKLLSSNTDTSETIHSVR